MEIIWGKPLLAQENMLLDEELLQKCKTHPQITLHFYDWLHPSITYGYFLDPKKHLHSDVLSTLGWDLAKRPTGGGIIFHPYDMAFSLTVPKMKGLFFENPLENYLWINRVVEKSIAELLKRKTILYEKKAEKIFLNDFCFAHPSIFDVLMEGKKVAGAALRKKDWGYLYQGSILLFPFDEEVLRSILVDADALNAILQNSRPLFQESKDVLIRRRKLQQILINHLQKTLSSLKMQSSIS